MHCIALCCSRFNIRRQLWLLKLYGGDRAKTTGIGKEVISARILWFPKDIWYYWTGNSFCNWRSSIKTGNSASDWHNNSTCRAISSCRRLGSNASWSDRSIRNSISIQVWRPYCKYYRLRNNSLDRIYGIQATVKVQTVRWQDKACCLSCCLFSPFLFYSQIYLRHYYNQYGERLRWDYLTKKAKSQSAGIRIRMTGFLLFVSQPYLEVCTAGIPAEK